MNQNPDVLIVGGGLIGMMSAWQLARAGLKVSLLERGDTGRESSWAGGGILSPLYPWRYNDAVSQLAKWSQQAYPQLLAELQQSSGVDPQLRHSGLLVVDVDDRAQAEAWASRFEQNVEWLQADEVTKHFPALAVRPAEAAAWLPDVGQVRNPRLVKALRGTLEAMGIDIHTGCEVTDFVVAADRVSGVMTSAGVQFSAGAVVVAGGAWSGQLLAKTGVSIEVEPVRGQMLLYRAEPELLQEILLYQSRYVIPRRDGRILVGSTIERTGFDKSTTAAAREDLRVAALEILPALADYEIEHHWAGLRPSSPQGIPYIGEHPSIKGLYMNCGHFRNGVVLAPASVQLLVDIVLGQTPLFDPSLYKGNS